MATRAPLNVTEFALSGEAAYAARMLRILRKWLENNVDWCNGCGFVPAGCGCACMGLPLFGDELHVVTMEECKERMRLNCPELAKHFKKNPDLQKAIESLSGVAMASQLRTGVHIACQI